MTGAAKQPVTRILTFVADLHCGSTVAVCPPEITMDDGGDYHASKAQRWLYECWLDFWARAAARVEEARRLGPTQHYAAFGGDLIEGQHHGTTQILSGNTAAQHQVVNAVLEAPLSLKPTGIVVVRGTEAHAGRSAEGEEKIADGLRRNHDPVIRDPDHKTSSWFHFYGQFGDKMVDIAHQGRTGLREHTRGGAAVLHAHDIVLSYVKGGAVPPALALRGHHHRFNDSYDAAPTRVVTTGAWQLATAYVHKVAADSIADIGGVIVTLRDGQAAQVEKVQYRAERGAIWKAAA